MDTHVYSTLISYFLSRNFDVVMIEPSQNTYSYFENHLIETLIQCTYNWKIHNFKFYFLFNTREGLKSIIYVNKVT